MISNKTRLRSAILAVGAVASTGFAAASSPVIVPPPPPANPGTQGGGHFSPVIVPPPPPANPGTQGGSSTR